ncbi:hypothetical protein EMIT0347P_10470 [Pseudomonas sp. IT-347P]
MILISAIFVLRPHKNNCPLGWLDCKYASRGIFVLGCIICSPKVKKLVLVCYRSFSYVYSAICIVVLFYREE